MWYKIIYMKYQREKPPNYNTTMYFVLFFFLSIFNCRGFPEIVRVSRFDIRYLGWEDNTIIKLLYYYLKINKLKK